MQPVEAVLIAGPTASGNPSIEERRPPAFMIGCARRRGLSVMLEVKQAIKTAKTYVQELYAEDESISNLGLEETEYDDGEGIWKITLGFSRPFNAPRTRAAEILDRIGSSPQQRRSYKIVTIRNDGHVVSMKNRVRTDPE